MFTAYFLALTTFSKDGAVKFIPSIGLDPLRYLIGSRTLKTPPVAAERRGNWTPLPARNTPTLDTGSIIISHAVEIHIGAQLAA
jgi:hypothetical protein